MAVITEFKIVDKASTVLSKISSKVNSITSSYNSLENKARRALNNISGTFPKLSIESNKFFTKMTQEAEKMTDNIIKKIKSIKLSFQSLFGLYLSFKGFQSFFQLNDKILNSNIKLGMMGKDDNERVLIEKQIFKTSQKLGVDYTDFQNQVYKLSKLTGDTFKNEFEAIRFNDIMQKVFKVSGSNTQESTNAMYQLTQALGSGRLQGDEFRSIAEQAPMLARQIADVMGVQYAELKKLGSEGKITSSIIKQAVFNMADDINQKVSKMPDTWSQKFNQVSNYIIRTLQPVVIKFQKLGDNPLILRFLKALGVVFYVTSVIISGFLTVIDKVFSVINYLLPVITILGIMITLIYSKVIILTVATTLWNAIVAITTLFVGGLSAAFTTLNAIMYANPIGAIIAALVGLIAIFVGVIKVINHFSGTTHSVLGSVLGGLYVFGAFVGNIFIGIWNGIKTFINTIVGAFKDFGEAISLAFSNPFKAVGLLLRGFMTYILGLLKSVVSISDTLLGTKYGDKISSYEKDINQKINSYFELEDKKDNTVFNLTTGFDYKSAFEKGAGVGDAWYDKLAQQFKTNEENFDLDKYLRNIENNTSTIAANTNDYKENIQLMRELAVQDYITTVSSPNINVQVYQNNTVPNKESAKDVISTLSEELNEAITRVALGGVN